MRCNEVGSRTARCARTAARVATGLCVLGLGVACDRTPSHDHPPPTASAAEPIPSGSLRVAFGESSAVVKLAGLQRTERDGSAKVRLLDVWEAARLHAAASQLRFDFVGSDGFHPTSRPKCPELIDGALLDRGYVDPATRTNLLGGRPRSRGVLSGPRRRPHRGHLQGRRRSIALRSARPCLRGVAVG